MPNSENVSEEILKARIRDLIQELGKASRVSQLTGIPLGTLNKYVALTSVPSATNALKIARAAGITLEDLLSSSGTNAARRLDGARGLALEKGPAPIGGVDPLLMEKLYKAVERVYRDAGQRPPGHRIANEATELLNMLSEKVTDIRDELIVDAVIPALAQKLVERLAEAAAEPGTGKRSA